MPGNKKQIKLEIRRLVEEHFLLNYDYIPENTEILIGRLQYLINKTYKDKNE